MSSVAMFASVCCTVCYIYGVEGLSIGKSLRVWACLASGDCFVRVIMAVVVPITAQVLFNPEFVVMTPIHEIWRILNNRDEI